jgi:hypothetical protein
MFTAKAAAAAIFLALNPLRAVGAALAISGFFAGGIWMGAKAFIGGVIAALPRLMAVLAGTSAAAGAVGAGTGVAAAGATAGRSWALAFAGAAAKYLGPIAVMIGLQDFLDSLDLFPTNRSETMELLEQERLVRKDRNLPSGPWRFAHPDLLPATKQWEDLYTAAKRWQELTQRIPTWEPVISFGAQDLADDLARLAEVERLTGHLMDPDIDLSWVDEIVASIGKFGDMDTTRQAQWIAQFKGSLSDVGIKAKSAFGQLADGTWFLKQKFAERFPQLARALDTFGIKTGRTAAKADRNLAKVKDSLKNNLSPEKVPLSTWGGNLIREWWSGVKSAWDRIKGAFGRILNRVKVWFGVDSPPKNPVIRPIRKWGRNLIGEWAAGIDDGVRGPLSTALANASNLAASISGASIQTPTISSSFGGPIAQGMGGPVGSLIEIATLLREQNRQMGVQNQLLAQLVAEEPGAAEPVTARGELAHQAFLMPGGRV